ncbi:MAG: LON peptidase substrate-binding domain-containing protein [Planctomycetota bacterium]|nr:LON peptidase substrate-binding domain-containing protein [Planctomycetota bacterium]
MSEESSIQVNFGHPMPLFPLDQATLLPQQLLPLHIFEPRYRQMIEHALDGAGQFALAVFEGDRWKQEYHGRPPLRRAVCIAQIVQHEKLPDGRYNVLVQGVCRARILREVPAEAGRQYRTALLEPVGLSQAPPEVSWTDDTFDDDTDSDDASPSLAEARGRIRDMLAEGPLTQLTHAAPVLEYLRNDELPTSAVLEVVSFTLITDPTLRYALLAEGDADARAAMIVRELEHLADLVRRAALQHPEEWPKGCSWN